MGKLITWEKNYNVKIFFKRKENLLAIKNISQRHAHAMFWNNNEKFRPSFACLFRVWCLINCFSFSPNLLHLRLSQNFMTKHDFPSIINENLSHTYIGKLIMFFAPTVGFLSFVGTIRYDESCRYRWHRKPQFNELFFRLKTTVKSH